jgi:hypothetical protein
MFLFFKGMAREGYVTHQDLRKAMQATFLSLEKRVGGADNEIRKFLT